MKPFVIGENRDGKFYFVESVKNGFVPATRQKVFDAIKGREINNCPFVNLPEKKGKFRMDREKMATVRWLQPRIVAEIAFNERTQGGHLRHSKFLRLRERAEEQEQELPQPKPPDLAGFERAQEHDRREAHFRKTPPAQEMDEDRNGGERKRPEKPGVEKRERRHRDGLA